MDNEQTEQTEWDLTAEECAELRDRVLAKIGHAKLIDAMMRQFGLEVEKEEAWWEAVARRLNVPDAMRVKLVADYKTGKVWVKGTRPTDIATHDNPAS